jgi:uncharacterized protein YndB with AHSA1/START domain
VATDTIHIDAPPAAVYDVLSDGWRYSAWVVGTSHMYAVQSQWPAAGSKLWHATGAWPFVVRDETQVVSVEPERRMELVARGRPFGEARIVLDIDGNGSGCRVTMDEQPTGGLIRSLHNRLSEAMLHRRNAESLARLKALAERRTEPLR